MNPRKLSPRKIMEAISEGDLKPQYIGKHSYDTLKQMSFSLFNEFKPQTMQHREIRDWLSKLIGVYDAIKKDLTEEEEKKYLLSGINEKLLPFVRSIDSNKDRALVSAICVMTQKALSDLEIDEEKPCDCEKQIPKDDAIKSNPDDDDDGLMH